MDYQAVPAPVPSGSSSSVGHGQLWKVTRSTRPLGRSAEACMAELVCLLRATVRIATLAISSCYRVHGAALDGTS